MGQNHGAEPVLKAVTDAWDKIKDASDKAMENLSAAPSPILPPSPQPPCTSFLQCILNVVVYVFTQMDLISTFLNLLSAALVAALLYYAVYVPMARYLSREEQRPVAPPQRKIRPHSIIIRG